MVDPRPHHQPRRAFTLLELLVALLIAAGIAAAAAISISRSLTASDAAAARQSARAAASAAVDLIARDAAQLVRSPDLIDARLLLADSGSGSSHAHDEILLFAHSARPPRASEDQPPANTLEVQYRLQNPADPRRTGYTLWRRADPQPDSVPDGGGVAVPVVLDILSLSIDAFDGSQWLAEWDSDRDGYPHALRVTAVAAVAGPRGSIEAASTRTVAIDRVPLPTTSNTEGDAP